MNKIKIDVKIKKFVRSAMRTLEIGKCGKTVDNYFGKPILSAKEGNNLISEMLDSNGPLLVARIGETELSCLNNYLKNDKKEGIGFKTSIRNAMSSNAGFFPATDEMLYKFCRDFLDHLRNVDIMGVWFNKNEDLVCRDHSPDTRLVRLRSLEPYYHATPWSLMLKDKKVLVVHPFQKTIVSQIAQNRNQLFNDPAVLPPFILDTVKAVQSIAGNETGFKDWFQAYRHMCDEIEQKDFDVAIIGAGAYGLPLASFVKKMGKKAIHMGGATQILFGIKGKRWDEHEEISKMYNKCWVRPSPDEFPEEYKKVEQGCYW